MAQVSVRPTSQYRPVAQAAPGDDGGLATSAIKLTGPLAQNLPEDASAAAPSHLLPKGTFDTHVHVFDPRLVPYSPRRAYTPPSAPFDELLSFSRSLTTSTLPANLVIVQPSPYLTDNKLLLSTLRQCQQLRLTARGIAVVDFEKLDEGELQEMHNLGVRGLRLNMQAEGHDVDAMVLNSLLRLAADRIKHLPGWKLQMFAPAKVWTDLYYTILDLPVVVIADHVGGLLGPSKLSAQYAVGSTLQPGFESLITLAARSKVLIKISGLYRSSTEASTGFADMAPIIRQLAIQVPNSLLWGSDWPHTGDGEDRVNKENLDSIEPFRVVENLELLRNLRKWVSSEETWVRMMIKNPAIAYA